MDTDRYTTPIYTCTLLYYNSHDFSGCLYCCVAVNISSTFFSFYSIFFYFQFHNCTRRISRKSFFFFHCHFSSRFFQLFTYNLFYECIYCFELWSDTICMYAMCNTPVLHRMQMNIVLFSCFYLFSWLWKWFLFRKSFKRIPLHNLTRNAISVCVKMSSNEFFMNHLMFFSFDMYEVCVCVCITSTIS